MFLESRIIYFDKKGILNQIDQIYDAFYQKDLLTTNIINQNTKGIALLIDDILNTDIFEEAIILSKIEQLRAILEINNFTNNNVEAIINALQDNIDQKRELAAQEEYAFSLSDPGIGQEERLKSISLENITALIEAGRIKEALELMTMIEPIAMAQVDDTEKERMLNELNILQAMISGENLN